MFHYDRGSSYASSSHPSASPMNLMTPKVSKLSTELVTRSISYHGLPLQKMWEGERGENDLQQQGLLRPDYSMYQQRQKYLTFQDRAKRLKLHQFISKKADEVFSQKLLTNVRTSDTTNANDGDVVVQIPPYEVFLNVDPYDRTRHFFQTIQIGDIIYGSVASMVKSSMLIKIICASGSIQRFVGDLGIKAMLPIINTVPVFNKINDRYDVNDYVCCEVLELSPESQKIILTMKGEFPRSESLSVPFGLITTDNFPEVYKTASETKNLSYNEVLEISSSFKNPNSEDALFLSVGLNPNTYYTNMTSLNGKFPVNEYASQIRQDQASKWAFRSVAEGIEHFKEGRHSEAFSCLNKALNIDSRNVEGLVARGALYANSGSFKKAVEDFEAALHINSSHANARKYLGETLVALGRSYEDENKHEDARKAYQDCLKVIPMHEEALNSLEYLRNRGQSKMIVPPTELVLPPLNLNKGPKLGATHSSRQDKKRKDKPKKKKKRHDSSSSGSGSSSDSSDSSSHSSSSSSDSEHSKQKGKKRSEPSPFSQQMMKGGHQFNQPFSGLNFNPETDDYESKVRHFLDMARDDDDHKDKVRKLIEDAARYQEERKSLDEKSKKKKRKEDKKAKKESKKKRKKEKKSKKSKMDLNEMENAKIREALKIFESLPVLDDLGAKLSEIYGVKNEPRVSALKIPQAVSVSTKANKSFEDNQQQSKWKMSFQSKDDPRPLGIPGPSKIQSRAARPGKGLTPPDSDDEKRQRDRDTKAKPTQSIRIPSPLKQYGRAVVTNVATAPAPPVKSGPVVLDKFGCFRLANADPLDSLPSESSRDRKRSRSLSRNRSYNYNRRRRSRSSSSENKRKRGKRSPSRDFYKRLAISRSRSRSPVRSFRGRGNRGGNRSYLDRKRRSRSRSHSHPRTAVSPIRATNPLGRPFGGGRGRGTSRGRWRGVNKRFNNRDRSASKSPQRRYVSKKRGSYNDRYPSGNGRSNRSRSKTNAKPNSDDKQKSLDPKKGPESKSEGRPNVEIEAAPRITTHSDDPPPPGTEDDIMKVM